MNGHISRDELDLYSEGELSGSRLEQVERHLEECRSCQARAANCREWVGELRALPREAPSPDLAPRIAAAVDLRIFQGRLRRSRLPFVAAAMGLSVLLVIWFGIQTVVALQDNGTLYLFSLLTSRPEILLADSVDTIWACIEALPLLQAVLMLSALFTVIVLVQQWIDTANPRTSTG
jgi:predicted anti-sigma-YlaC factor YlaD